MTPSFSQPALVYFYSPLPGGLVDLTQGCINTPVLPGTPDVDVVCQIVTEAGIHAPFAVVDSGRLVPSSAGLSQLIGIIETASTSQQWYSPHARSVLARYAQWALWQDQLFREQKGLQPPAYWQPTLSFLDPVQELNSPAYMALQDRQSWTAVKVLQLFPSLLPEGADRSKWPLVEPWVAAMIWFNLAKFLHTHSKCPNLVT